MTNPAIERVDPDGTLREGVEALDAARTGQTRSQLFKRGGALAGAGLALGAIPAGFAIAQGGLPKGDIKILNYALTLEYLEAAFYAEADQKGELSGESAIFAQVVGEHEQAHVDALKKTLGSKAGKAPEVDFKDATGKAKFLQTAKIARGHRRRRLPGPGDRDRDRLRCWPRPGSILAVEARHAAWVRDIIGGGKGVNPAPDAFEMPQDMAAILDAVKGTGFLKG